MRLSRLASDGPQPGGDVLGAIVTREAAATLVKSPRHEHATGLLSTGAASRETLRARIGLSQIPIERSEHCSGWNPV